MAALAGLPDEQVRRFRRKFCRYFDRPPKAPFHLGRAARADVLNAADLSRGEIARQWH